MNGTEIPDNRFQTFRMPSNLSKVSQDIRQKFIDTVAVKLDTVTDTWKICYKVE
jgi:hypothetical protein